MKIKVALLLPFISLLLTRLSLAEVSVTAPLPNFMDKQQLTEWNAQQASQSSAKSVQTNVFYTGKPFAADAGGYLFKYRTYNPEMSRWTSADPSGFPDGPNNQGYHPVPTSELDPNGLTTVTLPQVETIITDVTVNFPLSPAVHPPGYIYSGYDYQAFTYNDYSHVALSPFPPLPPGSGLSTTYYRTGYLPPVTTTTPTGYQFFAYLETYYTSLSTGTSYTVWTAAKGAGVTTASDTFSNGNSITGDPPSEASWTLTSSDPVVESNSFSTVSAPSLFNPVGTYQITVTLTTSNTWEMNE